MRKLVVIFGIVFLGIAAWAGNFYYQNLRGAKPAISPVIRDITESFSKVSESSDTNSTGMPLRLPSGFSISIFAKDLGNPRMLAWDPTGVLLSSIPSRGSVVALPDVNADGSSDEVITVVSGLNLPHGLAFHNGKLYIAETNGVSMFEYDAASKKATNKKKLFDLPAAGNHFSRTIGFGPDGRLYVTIGSSCNVCVEKDSRRAKMMVANADGSGLKDYATGLRNSVFFVWHPVTKKLWATDMGRDLIGDNIPPEEVNILEEGRDYGWPYCYGNRVHDNDFDPKKVHSCDTTVPPHIAFQAHSAPLGLAFIPDSWPSEYRKDLLVVYHGSWNRTDPTGYKVARFDLDDRGDSKGESDFLSGFLEGEGVVGRPVDVSFDAKGNLFVSDDKAGVVYKISQK
jgi:glucose/arabinose dehydrogenase